MKLPFALSTLAGLAIAGALIGYFGIADISVAIAGAGWGLLAVIGFHFVQMVFSSLAWRAVIPQRSVPGLSIMMAMRWIREAVNALLPVAQIGGEFVGARLLSLRGVSLAAAGASVTVDLTMEMVSQIVFTLIGLMLLILRPHDQNLVRSIGAGLALGASVVVLFILTQRFGLFRLIERGLVWLAEKTGWSALSGVGGLHAAIATLYKRPRRLCIAGGHHLISWLLGGLEVMLAFYVLGISIDLREGLIIESLGQALRALGFAVPGALGVQEGGYVLICGLLGIAPQAAIEMSLLKRIREIALGLPALLAWQMIEGRWVTGRLALVNGERRRPELVP